ncbi:MAG TPA: glycogen/starch synthase, partial [Geobacteraceae bacterium]|nr:glycogen/starch synthase [Geobacteraceae bacterium]
MKKSLRVLMVASENDALVNCKVGGIGDVVRDVPGALASLRNTSCQVAVVVPSYGYLHEIPMPGELLKKVKYNFGGRIEEASIFKVHAKKPQSGVTHYVIHHPSFKYIDPVSKQPRIYFDDPPKRPFATDATKFARFCAAV